MQPNKPVAPAFVVPARSFGAAVIVSTNTGPVITGTIPMSVLFEAVCCGLGHHIAAKCMYQ